jgi:hypothetical protein
MTAHPLAKYTFARVSLSSTRPSVAGMVHADPFND